MHRPTDTRPVPLIRDAAPRDADALAGLAERSFREAFAADNTTGDMDAYVAAHFTPAHLRAQLEDAGTRFVLAAPDPQAAPVGYAKLRLDAAPPGGGLPAPAELHRLYVLQDWVGTGTGAALLNAGLAAAREAGRRTLWLGVWERNERAIAFYERFGFGTVGTVPFRLGDDLQTDLIMARPL